MYVGEQRWHRFQCACQSNQWSGFTPQQTQDFFPPASTTLGSTQPHYGFTPWRTQDFLFSLPEQLWGLTYVIMRLSQRHYGLQNIFMELSRKKRQREMELTTPSPPYIWWPRLCDGLTFHIPSAASVVELPSPFCTEVPWTSKHTGQFIHITCWGNEFNSSRR